MLISKIKKKNTYKQPNVNPKRIQINSYLS